MSSLYHCLNNRVYRLILRKITHIIRLLVYRPTMNNQNDNTIIALSGDVGGTKTRLQLTKFTADGTSEVLAVERYRNSEFGKFRDIISTFLKAHPSDLHCACIAVAGPITEGCVKLTNLPWHFSEEQICKLLNINKVKFINDFEAIAYGVPLINAEDYHTLQPGIPDKNALIAIIGAGTGLGVALVDNTNSHPKVIATEGGHMDFAPADDIQMQLLHHLRKKLHRVSNERIVSGKGIENIYKFMLTTSEYAGHENPQLKHLSHFSTEFAADITRYALEHDDPIALHTLDTFLKCYGAVAGNLALTTLPFAGLYIAGGIAPKLLPQMQDGRFMDAFLDKGRMSNLLLNVPVRIILNTQVGLIGAAYYAAYLIGD